MIHRALKDFLIEKSTNQEQYQADPHTVLQLLTDTILKTDATYVHEMITVEAVGYHSFDSKHGHDGKCPITNMHIEAKISTINIPDENDIPVYTRGIRKGKPNPPRKFDGSGIFSSYTPLLFEQKFADTVQILASGFLNGELMYVIEFPNQHDTFKNHLLNKLNSKFAPGKATKKNQNMNLHFSYRQYEDCEDAVLSFSVSDEKLIENEHYFSPGFFKMILEMKNK